MSKRTLTLKKTRDGPSSNDSSNDGDETLFQPERQRVCHNFSSLLNEKLGQEVERELYQHLQKTLSSDFPNQRFVSEYLEQAFNLIENLDPEGSVGNTYLTPRVLSGEILPAELVVMTNQELYPPKWEEIKDKRLNEIKLENAQTSVSTDMYKCGKCGKRECTYYQLQTRSQDEPMTTFITCLNCGNRFRD